MGESADFSLECVHLSLLVRDIRLRSHNIRDIRKLGYHLARSMSAALFPTSFFHSEIYANSPRLNG